MSLLTGPAPAEETSAPALNSPVDAGTTLPASSAPGLNNEKARLSYALGVNAASQLRKRSVEVDPDLYIQGFKAQLLGDKSLLSAAEATATVGHFQIALAKTEKEEKLSGSKQRGEKNKQEGDAFLAQNKTRDGVVTLASGLQYKVLEAGDGKKPTIDDTVVCNYRGTLVDGTEFNDTAKRGKPAVLPVKKLMKGWREALQLMPVGAKWQVVIPPTLGYGPRSMGKIIGPNSTLIFELELLSIKEKPAAATAAESNSSTDRAEQAESAADSSELLQTTKAATVEE